jgi:hypothetical protein
VSSGGGIVGFDVRDDLLDVSDGCIEPEDIHAIRNEPWPAVAARLCPLLAPSAMPDLVMAGEGTAGIRLLNAAAKHGLLELVSRERTLDQSRREPANVHMVALRELL